MSLEDHRRPGGRLPRQTASQSPATFSLLIPSFCRVVLDGATRRTARRLEAEGLPFVMVAGRKYRPLNEGRAWLARRI